MRKKKILAVILAVTLVPGFLFGCAAGRQGTASASSQAASKEDGSQEASSKTSSSASASPSAASGGASSGTTSSSASASTASAGSSSSDAVITPSETATPTPADAKTQAKAAADASGYTYIGGQTFKADIIHADNIPEFMHAGKISFGDGYLTYALHDFDGDGQDEMLLVTIQKDLLNVKVGDSYSYDAYDFRLHMFEQGSDGTFTEASSISLQTASLPVTETLDFFYKDYSGSTGIFYNLDGYEWTDDGGVGALVELGYKDGTLSVVNDKLASFSGDIGYTMDEDGIRSSFGEEGVEAFNSFGFNLADRSYNAPMIMDQDSSCIRLARISSSAAIDNESAISIPDLTGMLTYTVFDYIQH